jgi:hypothetical protein
MERPPRKLEQRTEKNSELEQQHHSEQRQTTREFSAAEEVIRHDAERTNLPEAIEIRLKRSTVELQPPAPWWKRWFR